MDKGRKYLYWSIQNERTNKLIKLMTNNQYKKIKNKKEKDVLNEYFLGAPKNLKITICATLLTREQAKTFTGIPRGGIK